MATTAKPSAADLQATIDQLTAENAALKSSPARRVTLKVSEKGGLSVYGLGRFPVTLYREQWAKLLDQRDDILQFIADHGAALKVKA